MPRPRGQTSVAKNQMQLAIALSSSLEESKTLELSKQAEELPASAIEDGAVPQNIKQMQKEFLERLQPPTRAGPTKRSKKVANLPIPILLSRSAEERLRIITEKVALVLIQEDKVDWAPPTIPTVGIKKNVLWDKSSSLPFEADRNSYYTAPIALFVPPTKVEVGIKLSNPAALPGLLKTPVTNRPKLNVSNLSQPETQKKHNFNEWSHLHHFSPKSIDQDQDAQTELVNDWGRMLNNTALSDMTITLKEGKKLSAHKLVLYARCPAMLNDLDDKNQLLWKSVSQTQALGFLEFIYSGRLGGIRNLRPHVQGVAWLARKYNVTELLKLILTFGYNEEHGSNGCDFIDVHECNLPDRNLASQNESGSILVNMEAAESVIEKNIPDESPSVDLHMDDDELLKDFFGTCNPMLPSGNQSCTTYSPLQIACSSSNHNAALSSPENIDCDTFSPQGETKTPSYEMYDFEMKLKSVVTSSPQCYTNSLSAQNLPVDNQKVLLLVDKIGSESSEMNQTKLLPGNIRSIESHILNDAPTQDHIEISSDDELIPIVQTSTSSYKYVKEQNDVPGSSQSFQNMKLKPSTKGPKPDFSKRKLGDDDSEEENWTPKKVCISELINICSSDDSLGSCQMISSPKLETTPSASEKVTDSSLTFNNSVVHFDEEEPGEKVTSPSESLDSTIKAHILTPNLPENTLRQNLDSSFNLNYSLEYFSDVETNQPMSLLNQSHDSTMKSDFLTPNVPAAKSKQDLDDSLNLNNSAESFNEIEMHQPLIALNQSFDSTIIDHCFSTPKLPKDKTTARRSVTLEKKMLDDSFMFDVNDSYLLGELESKQTIPFEDKIEVATSFIPLRTPLEDVKTSSPVTPLPDFNAMSDQQFQTELLKYGLKRNMTKNRGIKMLKYIYGQMHPLVEVVNVQGKQLFIPIGEKTPTTNSAATLYPAVPSPELRNDESSRIIRFKDCCKNMDI